MERDREKLLLLLLLLFKSIHYSCIGQLLLFVVFGRWIQCLCDLSLPLSSINPSYIYMSKHTSFYLVRYFSASYVPSAELEMQFIQLYKIQLAAIGLSGPRENIFLILQLSNFTVPEKNFIPGSAFSYCYLRWNLKYKGLLFVGLKLKNITSFQWPIVS